MQYIRQHDFLYDNWCRIYYVSFFFLRILNLEELAKNNVALWSLGLLFAGFVTGIGAYKAILEIAHLKVISLSQWDSIQSLLGGRIPTALVPTDGTVRNEIVL